MQMASSILIYLTFILVRISGYFLQFATDAGPVAVRVLVIFFGLTLLAEIVPAFYCVGMILYSEWRSDSASGACLCGKFDKENIEEELINDEKLGSSSSSVDSHHLSETKEECLTRVDAECCGALGSVSKDES